MYRWHACLSQEEERWLGMMYRDLFGSSGQNGNANGDAHNDHSSEKERRRTGSESVRYTFQLLNSVLLSFCLRMLPHYRSRKQIFIKSRSI